MLPGIDNRIDALIKAMETVIQPAVDPGNGLAQEQVALSIGHLELLKAQWDRAALYEEARFQELRELAAGLLAIAEGGARSLAAKTALASAIDSMPAVLPRRAEALVALWCALGKHIDGLIHAAFDDGSKAFRAGLEIVMLTYGDNQAWRDRVWFQSTGLDPRACDLASIDDMLAAAPRNR